MGADRRRAPPVGHRGAPLENIALVNSDGSDPNLEIPVSQLCSRPIGPGELAALRAVWWRQASAGHRSPAKCGVIVIEGGAV